ncbi:MAG: hypothetical protein ACD_37C00191G0001 [uncultured bacterium]|nr:MAG: hypothetical protein ACD_37C00191G0001 [uncultured bacterium]
MGAETKGAFSFIPLVRFVAKSISEREKPAYPGISKMSSKVREIRNEVFCGSIINLTTWRFPCQYGLVLRIPKDYFSRVRKEYL